MQNSVTARFAITLSSHTAVTALTIHIQTIMPHNVTDDGK